MTNLEMLCEGIKEIAVNHKLNYDVSEIETDGEVCIWGGCTLPTLADVEMLCDDVKMARTAIEGHEYGIDVFFEDEWYSKYAFQEYEQGNEFWRRRC